MKILVTGGGGYIGSALVTELLTEGHDVRVLDKGIYSLEPLLSFMSCERFELIVGDVRDDAVLNNALDGVEAVVHLAALVGEAACNIDPDATRHINHKMTKTLLSGCEVRKIERFVFLSTCSNYGVSDPDVVATEDSALKPLSLYAETKVASEKDVLAHDGITATTVLRLGTICGLSARMRFDLLVSELALFAVQNRRIEIYKPDAWRPFVHVQDAVRAVRNVLDAPKDRIDHRVFNIVAENLQKRDLQQMVLRHFPQADIKITTANPDNRDYRVSGERVTRELGFTCRASIEDAFLQTAQSVRDRIFRDLAWAGHSAIPLPDRAPLIAYDR